MGPLVPVIISDQFNLVIALIMGFGFGFTLEQAGFSNSKKLVGLFYGYDFVVLKVFFTAGVTAMIGVIFLGHFGWLDLNLIFINPTFLRSAIIGGVIMGFGFVIGGFCPGTSLCAASIGKLDAMIFVIGSLVGIYLFLEAYPVFEKIYLADNLGSPTINQMLGLSSETFAFILTLIAAMVFVGVTMIENKVNNRPNRFSPRVTWNASLIALIPFLFILVSGFTPSTSERISRYLNNPENIKRQDIKTINPDKLAFELVNNYYQYNIIDLRSPGQFKSYHLPLAINIPLDSMVNREWEGYFKQTLKTNIFYSDDTLKARKGYLLSGFLGKADRMAMNSTPDWFRNQFYRPVQPSVGASKDAVNLYYFRLNSGRQMDELVKSLERFSSKPRIIKFKKAQGGCS